MFGQRRSFQTREVNQKGHLKHWKRNVFPSEKMPVRHRTRKQHGFLIFIPSFSDPENVFPDSFPVLRFFFLFLFLSGCAWLAGWDGWDGSLVHSVFRALGRVLWPLFLFDGSTNITVYLLLLLTEMLEKRGRKETN